MLKINIYLYEYLLCESYSHFQIYVIV